MTAAPDRTGLCIVRVWPRDGGLVAHIRTRSDVEAPATERESSAADIEGALQLVRAFLVEAAASWSGGRRPPTP